MKNKSNIDNKNINKDENNDTKIIIIRALMTEIIIFIMEIIVRIIVIIIKVIMVTCRTNSMERKEDLT